MRKTANQRDDGRLNQYANGALVRRSNFFMRRHISRRPPCRARDRRTQIRAEIGQALFGKRKRVVLHNGDFLPIRELRQKLFLKQRNHVRVALTTVTRATSGFSLAETQNTPDPSPLRRHVRSRAHGFFPLSQFHSA
ncbi:MAG: hypothetical protein ACLUI3_13650 [Christensenellales bacterium]